MQLSNQLSAATITEIAQAAGLPVPNQEFALRIAVGAANAVNAVVNSLGECLFDTEPADYLVELERAAGYPDDGSNS